MPPFSSKPLVPSRLSLSLRRRPFLLFGLPFLSVLVLSSFALSSFTQTRYDYRSHKVQALTKEDELGMRKDRRRIDVREEYHRMQALDALSPSSWENKRVERLPGQAEWGELPTPEEARRVVEGLGGVGMLGRTLHVEPKRALKPGEKEAIEREKQLKRIRSVQVLACAGAGGGATGGGGEGWNRREGGYGQPLQQQSSFGFGQPQQYQSHLHQQQQQQWYARAHTQLPLAHHFHHQQSSEHDHGHANLPLSLTSSSSPYPLAQQQQQQQQHQQYQPYHLPTDLGYSPTLNSSPPESDVGTSVSMRTTRERGLTGGTSTDGVSGESESGRDGVGSEGGRRRTASDELDLNDPATLDIYSLILLFRDDPLRDELARTLIPRRGNDIDAHFAIRVQLRHSASTASVSLRRPASHSNLLLNPPTTPSRYPNGNNANASSTSTSSYLSPSPSLGALNLRGKKSMPDIRYSRDGHILPPPPPPSSSSAFYSYRSSSSGGREGLSPVSSSSRSASPAPPPPPPVPLLSQSTSLSANLAAYSNGFGYASTQHQYQHQHSDGNGNGSGGAGGIGKGNGVYLTPQAKQRRRSQLNLREGYATPISPLTRMDSGTLRTKANNNTNNNGRAGTAPAVAQEGTGTGTGSTSPLKRNIVGEVR
ncbi:hypothetical protein JCM11641_004302 [Rhodosporidiobolus odoratus]